MGPGGGVFELKGPWGTTVSRNITSSKTKGLGDWTDDEIKRAITQGIRKDGTKLRPPMGFQYYAKMTDERPRRRRRLSAHGAGEGIGPAAAHPAAAPPGRPGSSGSSRPSIAGRVAGLYLGFRTEPGFALAIV